MFRHLENKIPLFSITPPAPLPALIKEVQAAVSRRIWEPFSVFATTFLLLTLVAPRIMTYLNPVTGDEPFYLMTAISILQDHDLNECNNYRQQQELSIYPGFYEPWQGFPQDWVGWRGGPFPLAPHAAHISPASRMCTSTNPLVALPANGTGSELYSKHGLGLSLLVLPAFAAGGREIVVFFLAFLGALLAANVYLLARESTRQRWPAVLTWLAFAFTIPQLPYSFLIFPELPAGLMVLYAFRRIRLWNNNWVQVGAVGACIAFLPWLHYRFVPISAALFVYYLYSSRKRSTLRPRVNFTLISSQSAVSATLLMAFFYQRYQQVYPNSADHAGISDVAGTLRGAAGTFLDVQWGLFVAAPVYILAIVGVILMGGKKPWRADLLWIGLIFVPYFVLIANYAQWWGEWCPPARYLASVLPLFALPFALSLERIRHAAYKGIYGALMALSLLSAAGFIYQPQWLYNQPDANNQLILKGLPELMSLLPDRLANLIHPYAINDALPTFVRPYFAYLQLGQVQGGLWANIAWETSVIPALIVAAIVGMSLVLAWLTRRRYNDFIGATLENTNRTTTATNVAPTLP